MPLFDLSYDELVDYRPTRNEPEDFDDFWRDTLAEARRHDLDPRFEPVESHLVTLDVFDVTFSGWDGQRIKGWFVLPRGVPRPLPCVVEYLGYGCGRGLAHEWLHHASAGYANLVMDNRGQSAHQEGATPDREVDSEGAQVPGFMTRGITSPKTYYYRRLMTDAVRAVEVARAHPDVDPARVAVTGTSQGGGLALTVGGLVDGLSAVAANVPFLCHYQRATEITDKAPYQEIVRYFRSNRETPEIVFRTLSYFDGVNFAARASAPTLISVALMDDICPPSTVYAAYNHCTEPKEIRVWRYNEHDGGGAHQHRETMSFLAKAFSKEA